MRTLAKCPILLLHPNGTADLGRFRNDWEIGLLSWLHHALSGRKAHLFTKFGRTKV